MSHAISNIYYFNILLIITIHLILRSSIPSINNQCCYKNLGVDNEFDCASLLPLRRGCSIGLSVFSIDLCTTQRDNQFDCTFLGGFNQFDWVFLLLTHDTTQHQDSNSHNIFSLINPELIEFFHWEYWSINWFICGKKNKF